MVPDLPRPGLRSRHAVVWLTQRRASPFVTSLAAVGSVIELRTTPFAGVTVSALV